jgi:hypothetical protein
MIAGIERVQIGKLTKSIGRVLLGRSTGAHGLSLNLKGHPSVYKHCY